MRVVLDTNVLVSLALRSRAMRPLREGWEDGRFVVLTSTELIDELESVLGRAKFSERLGAAQRMEFLAFVGIFGETVISLRPYPEFDDPKDRFLLAMLRDGEADALVMGDKALLEMRRFEGTPIFSPAEFTQRLEGDVSWE